MARQWQRCPPVLPVCWGGLLCVQSRIGHIRSRRGSTCLRAGGLAKLHYAMEMRWRSCGQDKLGRESWGRYAGALPKGCQHARRAPSAGDAALDAASSARASKQQREAGAGGRGPDVVSHTMQDKYAAKEYN